MSRVELGWSGGVARCFHAAPEGEGKAGAILVVHEWWGLNDDMRRISGRFAELGLHALAVDLYGGEVTGETQRAMELAGAMRTADAMLVLQAAQRWVVGSPWSNGKVAVTGFCLGGATSLAAAANVYGLATVVPFYGAPRDEFLHYERMKAPILGHYAATDPFVDGARVRRIAEATNAAGGAFELHFYDAGHAFMREGDPAAYDAAAAGLAWERTREHLARHLA